MRTATLIIVATAATALLLLTLMPAIESVLYRHVAAPLTVAVVIYDERDGEANVIRPETPYLSIWDVMLGKVNPHYVSSQEVSDADARYYHVAFDPEMRLVYTVDRPDAVKIIIIWSASIVWRDANGNTINTATLSDTYSVPATSLQSGVLYSLSAFKSYGKYGKNPVYDVKVSDLYDTFVVKHNSKRGSIKYAISVTVKIVLKSDENTVLAEKSATASATVDYEYKETPSATINSLTVTVEQSTYKEQSRTI